MTSPFSSSIADFPRPCPPTVHSSNLLRWLLGVSTALWLILLLSAMAAALGRFNEALAAGLLACLLAQCGIAWAYLVLGLSRALRGDGAAIQPWWLALGALGILSYYCVAIYTPPEEILSYRDPGMYAAAASNIANKGIYPLSVNWPVELPQELQDWMLTKRPLEAQRRSGETPAFWSYSAGFAFIDQRSREGQVAIPFPIGFPTLLAAGMKLAPFTAAVAVNLVAHLAVAALFGIVLLHRFGARASILGASLFLFNPLLAVDAGRIYAEPLLLLCVATLLVGMAFRQERPIAGAALSGIAIGTGMLIKIDGIALLSAIPFIVLSKPRSINSLLAFSIAVALSVSISTYLALAFSSDYIFNTLEAVRESIASDAFQLRAIPVAAILSVGLIAGYLLFRYSRKSGFAFVKHVASAVLIVVFLYLYFILPNPDSPSTFVFPGNGNEIRSYQEESFFRLGWYFSPIGLWIALAALVAWIYAIRSAEQIWLLIAGVACLLFFSYDIRCEPRQPYCMRRFATYAIPCLLFAAASVPYLTRRRSRTSSVATLAVFIFLFVPSLSYTRSLAGAPEHPGLHAELVSMSAQLPKDGPILLPMRSPLSNLGTSLRFLMDKEIFYISPQRESPRYAALLQGWIDSRRRGGHPTYVLSVTPRERLGLLRLDTKILAEDAIQVTRLINTYESPPEGDTEQIEWRWILLQIL